MSGLQNPYAPPQADVAPQATTARHLLDASKRRRFLNVILDQIGMLPLKFACGVALDFAGLPATNGTWSDLLGLRAWYLYCVPMVVYYLFFEGVCARTPGKVLTRTRVLGRDGSRPRLRQIVGRTFARLIPDRKSTRLNSSHR